MKLPILIFLLLAGGSRLFAQIDMGRPSATPYDRHNGPVREVLARSGSSTPSIDEVRAQLRTARRFRYYFNKAEPYVAQAPEVTEARKQGDCKAKSLWLADKMRDRSVRYVVGKATPGARILHAWLIWSNSGTWLFLDPTMESDVIYADRVGGRKLIMKYSYTASSSYVHSSN